MWFDASVFSLYGPSGYKDRDAQFRTELALTHVFRRNASGDARSPLAFTSEERPLPGDAAHAACLGVFFLERICAHDSPFSATLQALHNICRGLPPSSPVVVCTEQRDACVLRTRSSSSDDDRCIAWRLQQLVDLEAEIGCVCLRKSLACAPLHLTLFFNTSFLPF